MSNVLITLKDEDREVHHTEETLDEWFRSLSARDKVRIFWMEIPADVEAEVH